jgi:hypothetical protein
VLLVLAQVQRNLHWCLGLSRPKKGDALFGSSCLASPETPEDNDDDDQSPAPQALPLAGVAEDDGALAGACACCGSYRRAPGARVIRLMLSRIDVCSEDCWRAWVRDNES